MAGFATLDLFAFIVFLASWIGYHIAVEAGPHSARSLNARMSLRRARWIEQAVQRDNRIIDTQVMNGLQNGTAFFASTSLLAIGGALSLLQSTDRVVQVFEDLPLATPTTRAAWEMKVIGLAVIFAYAFFKFAWSYRLFNYCAILLGAIPNARLKDEDETREAVRETIAMNIAAGRHFNRGQRAFFFALAYLGWFLGSWAFLAATLGVLTVMWRRQFASDSSRIFTGQ
ncbi:MAG: DUF599 domain-containing protein [Bosea sp. (in: a-proteobacteria)]